MFKCGFLYITLDTIYTKIMSRITASDYDIVGIVYHIDDNIKVIAYDNYTRERIRCIDTLDDVYNGHLVTKVLSSSLKISNEAAENVKIVLSNLLIEYENVKVSDNLVSLLSNLDECKLYGDIITRHILSTLNMSISNSSMLLFNNSSDTYSSMYNCYDKKLTILFSIIPNLLRNNNKLLSSLFLTEEFKNKDFDNSFPNISSMTIISDNMTNMTKISRGLDTIKDNVKEISLDLNKMISYMIDDYDPCIIDIRKLVLCTNNINTVLGLDTVKLNIDSGDYVGIIKNCDVNKVRLNSRVLLVPSVQPDLTLVPTAVLKDLVIYVNSIDLSSNLIKYTLEELSLRRL